MSFMSWLLLILATVLVFTLCPAAEEYDQDVISGATKSDEIIDDGLAYLLLRGVALNRMVMDGDAYRYFLSREELLRSAARSENHPEGAKRSPMPFSGGLYGKRSSLPYYSGGFFGKRAPVPRSGGLYGKRKRNIPDEERMVPISGGFYG